MAIQSQSGFLVEDKPQSITQQSMDQGIGTPESPMGANAVAGSTSKQQDMTGTPAQQQSAKQIRREAQSGQTLEQKRRYDQKPQTDAYTASKEKADTLKQLGPVRTAVQSLIEQQIQNVQGIQFEVQATDANGNLLVDENGNPIMVPNEEVRNQVAEMSVNKDAIDMLDVDQTVKDQADAALQAFIADPSEQNAQAFYNIVGQANLESGGISNYLQGGAEVFGQMAQSQIDQNTSLGALDLESMGIDRQAIANALGLEDVDQLAGMSLADLDLAIDQIEAQEFNQVEAIRNELANPNTPPARRQQLLRELSQLSAAGMTGAEASINALDEQIAAAQTVNIAGQEMSLEDALSDDGISATIARAVQDPEYLEKLAETPGYEGLAQWISDNTPYLEDLVGEIEDVTRGVVETQNEYASFADSFGPGSQDLLGEVLGIDLSDGAISAGDLDDMIAKAESNPMYMFLKNNPEYVTMLQGDEEFKKAALKLSDIKDMTEDSLSTLFDNYDTYSNDPMYSKLFGDFKLPTDDAELKILNKNIEAYNAIDDDIKNMAAELISNGTVDIETLTDIANSPDPAAVIADINDSKRIQSDWEDAKNNYEGTDGALQYLFGDMNLTPQDLTYALRNAKNTQAKALISRIFDENHDGTISEEEMNNIDILDKVEHYLGLGSDIDSIVKQGGKWNPEGIRNAILESMSPGSYRKETTDTIRDYYDGQLLDLQDTSTELATELREIENDLGVASFDNVLKKKDDLTQYNTLVKSTIPNLESRLKALKSTAISGDRGEVRAQAMARKEEIDALEAELAGLRKQAKDTHEELSVFLGKDINKLDMDKIEEGLGVYNEMKKNEDLESKYTKVLGSLDNLSDDELEELLNSIEQ